MRMLALLVFVFISAQATGEVCVENDTNLPEGSLSYGFIPEGQLNLKNKSHPILTPPPNFQLKHLENGDANCIEFFESEEKGTPGRLVVYIKPKSSSEQVYSSEDIAYISDQEATAPLSLTVNYHIRVHASNVKIVRSKQGDDPSNTFTVTKVFIPSEK